MHKQLSPKLLDLVDGITAKYGRSLTERDQLAQAVFDLQRREHLDGETLIQFANAGVDMPSLLSRHSSPRHQQHTREEIVALVDKREFRRRRVLAALDRWDRDQGRVIPFGTGSPFPSKVAGN